MIDILPVVEVSDLPRAYTAIAEWIACTVFVALFRKRFSFTATVFISLGFFAALFGLYEIPSEEDGSLIFIMTGAVALMFFYVYACCRVTLKDAGYILARAFIFAELTASLEWMLEYFFNSFSPLLAKGIFPIIYLGLAVLFYFAEKRHFPPLNCNTKSLISALLMALIVFAISNVSFITSDTPMSGSTSTDIFYIRFLSDLCGILLLYIFQEQRFADWKKDEIVMMENMLAKQYEQYNSSKENISVVKRYCHDIKHQLQVIRQETDDLKRARYLDEIEKNVKRLDNNFDTGSPALDVILSGKARTIQSEKIQFTCMADGYLLSFMDTLDICSIFGNSLDNAIEALVQLEETEKRLLKLSVFAKNEHLIVKVENYFKTPIIMEDGVLRTTKKDKTLHGIGITSIRQVAEKYDGAIKITTENDWFTLCILFPLSEPKEKPSIASSIDD